MADALQFGMSYVPFFYFLFSEFYASFFVFKLNLENHLVVRVAYGILYLNPQHSSALSPLLNQHLVHEQ